MKKKKQLQRSLPWIVLVVVLFLVCFRMEDALAGTTEKGESVHFIEDGRKIEIEVLL